MLSMRSVSIFNSLDKSHTAAMSRQLVVFDFDWSFVDQDTDRWVLEVLSTRLRRKLQTIKAGGSQCTPDVVAECMVALAEEDGIGREEVLESLRILPLHPAMKRAVTALRKRDPSTTFVCISNSNEVYIDTILKVRTPPGRGGNATLMNRQHHGLTDLFDTIITNPAHWEAATASRSADLLRVGRRIPADGPQHSCKVGCLENMCKGDELDEWIRKAEPEKGWEAFRKVVYIGDGGNDFCPLIRMRK